MIRFFKCLAYSDIRIVIAISAILFWLVLAAGPWPAYADSQSPTKTNLHSFSASSGAGPNGDMVLGADGAYYGTMSFGGTGYTSGFSGAGAVVKVATDGTTTVLHSFAGTDGSHPYCGLLLASDGNYYGTTGYGGSSYTDDSQAAYGTVFKVTPAGVFTTLHSFTGTDGYRPFGRLVQGVDGNLYGTTIVGGPDFAAGQDGYGTAFKITTGGNFTTLHAFTATDGAMPFAGLTQGGDGSFYGVCASGGSTYTGLDPFNNPNGYGTVFKMTTSGTVTTLHSFVGTDGACPRGALVLGNDGNYYSTTVYGGTNFSSSNAASFLNGYGSVYKVTTEGAVTQLYAFSGSDGLTPYCTLAKDSAGNFYGTTNGGGVGFTTDFTGSGTLFKITPAGTLTLQHSFSGAEDSGVPFGGLTLASDTLLFGTAVGTGSDAGSFFSIIPGT